MSASLSAANAWWLRMFGLLCQRHLHLLLQRLIWFGFALVSPKKVHSKEVRNCCPSSVSMMVGFLTMTTRGTLPASESCMPFRCAETAETCRLARPPERRAFDLVEVVEWSPPKRRALLRRSLVSRRKSVRWRRAEFRCRSAVSSGRANSGLAEMEAESLESSELPLKSLFRKAVGKAEEGVGASIRAERTSAERRTRRWQVKNC